MGLRETAAADFAAITTDDVYGFGWSLTITDPAGLSAPVVGLSNDISQVIDPDTGQAVSGRLATAVVSVAALTAAGLGIPEGISDSKVKPWLFAFADINGVAHVFKVAASDPDRAIGGIVCTLELYKQ